MSTIQVHSDTHQPYKVIATQMSAIHGRSGTSQSYKFAVTQISHTSSQKQVSHVEINNSIIFGTRS